MNDTEEKLMNRLNNILENDVEAINVKIFRARNQKFIEIMIESDQGVTINTCAEVTKVAQNIIKLDSLVDDDYSIEVSSPGINRPLFDIRDFIKYQGEKAFIELKRSVNNQKRFIREYKGLDIMLHVMSDDRIRSLGIKLIVAGEFYEDQEKYISMIDNLGISESIILKNDFIPEDNVKNYFCASDMVTQTYRTATQSGITQIAYHFERPMLVTNVGGLAEIVPDDEVGYVCNIDVKEISDSIIDFYQNERLEEFSMNTKRYKERFSWGSLVNGIDRLMKKN